MVDALVLILKLRFQRNAVRCDGPDVLWEVASCLDADQPLTDTFSEQPERFRAGCYAHAIAECLVGTRLEGRCEVEISRGAFMGWIAGIRCVFGETRKLRRIAGVLYPALRIKSLTSVSHGLPTLTKRCVNGEPPFGNHHA